MQRRLAPPTHKSAAAAPVPLLQPIHFVNVFDVTNNVSLPVVPYPPQPVYKCPDCACMPWVGSMEMCQSAPPGALRLAVHLTP